MEFKSYNNLCRYLNNEDIALEFAINKNLIKTTRICQCGGILNWYKENRKKYGYIFRCSKSKSLCGKQYSILHGTWFWNSNMSLIDQILIIYAYCLELTSLQFCGMFGINSSHTIADWQNYFRDICTIYINEMPNRKIGGVGLTVEIDESKIYKRKNHTGRLTAHESHSDWVFGGICRETKDAFFCIVEDRTENTLIQKILENVELGSHIVSDCWRSYTNILNHGYIHSTVNHSENFLNPANLNIHTQTIERAWRGLKDNIPKSSRYETRLSYLIVYEFKRRTNWYNLKYEERFELLLNLISQYY